VRGHLGDRSGLPDRLGRPVGEVGRTAVVALLESTVGFREERLGVAQACRHLGRGLSGHALHLDARLGDPRGREGLVVHAAERGPGRQHLVEGAVRLAPQALVALLGRGRLLARRSKILASARELGVRGFEIGAIPLHLTAELSDAIVRFLLPRGVRRWRGRLHRDSLGPAADKDSGHAEQCRQHTHGGRASPAPVGEPGDAAGRAHRWNSKHEACRATQKRGAAKQRRRMGLAPPRRREPQRGRRSVADWLSEYGRAGSRRRAGAAGAVRRGGETIST
jgi:hypothetical protein